MNFNLTFIGKSISHSILPQVYHLIGDQIGQKINVKSVEIGNESLQQVLLKLPQVDCDAACITFPYKREVLNLIDNAILTPRAMLSGAVNIIHYPDKSSVICDNTDGHGFLYDAKQNKQVNFHGKNILILGAGGVARGILPALIAECPRSLTLCNRDVSRLKTIAAEIAIFPLILCDYNSIPKMKYDIIINATSASIQNNLPPLCRDLVDASTICFECAYKFKGSTPFAQWAISAGVASYFDGIGMLVEQAVEAVKILLNKTVDAPFIIEKLIS